MGKMPMLEIPRYYKNNGQHAEQVLRYTITGEIVKADNIPASASGDCGDIQVKTAKASVCKGNSLIEHFKTDKAKRYAYVVTSFKEAYIMNRNEYFEFVEMFGYITYESQKNGGHQKIRLKAESKKMIEWLMTRA